MLRTPRADLSQCIADYRVSVYAGTDPLTRRQLRLRAQHTAKTETQAGTELGKLLEKIREGRNPDTAVTVAKLVAEGRAGNGTGRALTAHGTIA